MTCLSFLPRLRRLFAFLMLLAPVLHAALPPEYQFVSRDTSPQVAYRLNFDAKKNTLRVGIAVEPNAKDWPQPEVHLGLAAGKAVLLSTKDAKVSESGGHTLFDFTVNAKKLGINLDGLRLAFDVGWVNPANAVIQREHFFMRSDLAPFVPVGSDPAKWLPFSLVEHGRLMKNLALQIRVNWKQPVNGRASVVIDNADGVRVRNLVSGRAFSAGNQSVLWDGLDDAGNLVAPGKYRWRAVTHPGIQPKFLMSYYNPGKPGWKDGPTSLWLGDHSAPMAAASNGTAIALGCPVAEAGNNIVVVDPDGNKFQDGNLSSFIGLGNLFLAMDQERFYAFTEGQPHYEKIRKDENGKEFLFGSLSFVAWNLKDGTQFRYPGGGKNGDKVVREYRLDPATAPKHGGVHNMRGAVWLDGRLYLSLHDENKILMLDPDTGESKGELALTEPGALATDGKRLLAYSGTNLMLFDTPGAGGHAEKLFAPTLSKPRPLEDAASVAPALALSPDGKIYVADNGIDQNIKVYDLAGKPLFTIGRKGGGVEEGPWVADSVRLPLGLALDGKGQLWVAENHFYPKRISVWNAQDGTLVKELFGPTHYGASGGGFDTADTHRWIGGASLWDIDVDKPGSEKIESVLFSGEKPGMPSLKFYPFSAWFLHKDGRTFLVSKDNVMRLYEILPEGRAKLWAMLGTLHSYEAEHPRWWVPEVFTRHPKLAPILKDFTEVVGPFGNFRNASAASKDGRELSVLWVDQNGDDVAQVEEVQVAGDATHIMRSSIWGYHFEDTLDWKLAVALGEGRIGVGTLNLRGWLPSGAPDWSLEDAIMQARPVEDLSISDLQAFAQDSQGRFLLNADPMVGIDSENKVQWTFPNAWTGVHGSHKAPLPETGVTQGALSYLGVAPLDDKGDVTIVNGNHGRFFVLTTDGIYLDEMFQDVRLSRDASAYRIGGECFGGYFGRDKKSGRYLLQSGASDYRLFEILNLDKVERQQGELVVTPAQVAAAQKLVEKKVADATRSRSATLETRKANDPPSTATAEWGDAARSFPFAQATAYRSGTDLILRTEVKDPSPWVNAGKDRQLLFKTGDAVVFEFSTDPSAPPKRSEPAPGDKRLLIAPYLEKPIAILYDYRVPGTKDPVPFNSPWRTATVDRVTPLEHAVIEVKTTRDRYVVTARIPLADLGLPATGTSASLKGDFGVIYGDEKGTINILRSNWSNASTGLVNDVPGETMINPAMWGTLEWK
ncbi:MAG: hypothetical protein IAE94_10270 [Chthoniobacterales bacterium]|nr:hypothetical protein [Chthoniobacterales bacterium]